MRGGVASPVALALSACGGARGPSAETRHAAAAAAVTVAAAAATALIQGVEQRSGRGYATRHGRTAPHESHPPVWTDDVTPAPAPRPPSSRALALWRVPYAVEVRAEDLWCDQAQDCVRLPSIDGCAPERGGVDLAIRRASFERLRTELADTDPARTCPGRPDATQRASLDCIDNLCRLVLPDGLAPVPPPPGAPDASSPEASPRAPPRITPNAAELPPVPPPPR